MEIRYDNEADAMYITLKKGEYEISEEIGEGLVLDISKDGNIMGIEILDASEKFSSANFKKVLLNVTKSV